MKHNPSAKPAAQESSPELAVATGDGSGGDSGGAASPAPFADSSLEAKRLAAAVLEVLAGTRGPSEAAAALSISLPRYYQLEGRALEGLLAACEPRRGGRARGCNVSVPGSRHWSGQRNGRWVWRLLHHRRLGLPKRDASVVTDGRKPALLK